MMKYRLTKSQVKYSMVPKKRIPSPLIRNFEKNPWNWPILNWKNYFYLESTLNVEQIL